MNYSPILIPTLCRSEHFIRCIESLKKNTWAEYTDVYVALDYPAKEQHWDGYNKIRLYLEGDFSNFSSFHIIKREKNYGSARNMKELRELVLKKYDRFIRTDDDWEFSPNFLEYMNKCLDVFENDECVMGVTGYSYPVHWHVKEECTAFKSSLIFPMWGTGFWRDKFLKMENDIEADFIGNYTRKNNLSRESMTDARYIDCLSAATNYKNLLTKKFSDVSCGCYIQLTNRYVITPKISKVRNYGFDGSGVWCTNSLTEKKDSCKAKSYDYKKQKIDVDRYFSLVVDEKCDFQQNRDEINRFDNRSPLIIKSCEWKRMLQGIIGETLYKKLWSIKHKNG